MIGTDETTTTPPSLAAAHAAGTRHDDVVGVETAVATPDLGPLAMTGRRAGLAGVALLVVAVLLGAAVEGGVVSVTTLVSTVRDVALGFGVVGGTVLLLTRGLDRG